MISYYAQHYLPIRSYLSAGDFLSLRGGLKTGKATPNDLKPLAAISILPAPRPRGLDNKDMYHEKDY